MFRSFLIKYGEIGVKGKNRYLFEDALMRQIKYSLKKADGDFAVTKDKGGRIFVEVKSGDYDYDAVIDALQHVFGVIAFSPVVHVEDTSIENLRKEIIRFVGEVFEDRNFSFKINTRRAHKSYPMTSMEVDAALGEAVLEASDFEALPGQIISIPERYRAPEECLWEPTVRRCCCCRAVSIRP